MTEEDAKKCWCPFARASYTDKNGNAHIGTPSGNNRSAKGEPMIACLCIASKCAAWHWSEMRTHIVPTGYEANPSFIPPEGWIQDKTKGPDMVFTPPPEQRHGYCGLAGKP